MKVDPRILAQVKLVTSKRPLAVINHILKYGQVTTEELRELYGYDHPPRARMDVLEWGIPLITRRVPNRNGTKKIGAYSFGDPDKVESQKAGGRQPFSKAFKKLLYERQGGRCAITGERYELRCLSVDPRIPYELGGDPVDIDGHPEAFMLIVFGLQRVKSWSCEHCANALSVRDKSICDRCFWAHPEAYDHIATEQRRRLDIAWVGEEVKEFDALARAARRENLTVAEFVKGILRKIVAGLAK
jgi:hypothetical protein